MGNPFQAIKMEIEQVFDVFVEDVGCRRSSIFPGVTFSFGESLVDDNPVQVDFVLETDGTPAACLMKPKALAALIELARKHRIGLTTYTLKPAEQVFYENGGFVFSRERDVGGRLELPSRRPLA